MNSSPSIIGISSASMFVLLGLLLAISGAEAQLWPTFIDHFCTNDTFSANSTYKRNLDTVLSALSSNTSDYVRGFTSVERGSSDRIYGLLLCRGDQSPDSCRACVLDGTQQILQRCPMDKGSTMWYQECSVSISYQSFRSTIREALYLQQESGIASDPMAFNTMLNETLSSLIQRTANSQLVGRKFAVQRATFTASQPLYTLAQCTPDLNPTDCLMCLQMAAEVLHRGNRSARYLKPTCNLWYDDHAFYNETAVALLSPIAPPPLSPLTRHQGKSKISTSTIIAIVASVGITIVIFLILCCLLRRRAAKRREVAEDTSTGNYITTSQSIQFDFAVIQAATENFSDNKKLGEGGFGKVYRGVLPTGQVVAVKRLSRGGSGQGAEEFKNEVAMVAKLEHRNLVRTLGFSLEGEDKIIVYEYVPNKSLDYFLFDTVKRGILDWSRRYKIILGIARGMLYLHEDSRFKIIHRDLKAGNVLLDADMEPKISDFGIARIFEMDQTHDTTMKIVGTRGYMSPEYTLHGRFSVKSDAYSFGVLVLEIISSQKNSSFYQTGKAEDLPSYAWRHCKDGTPMEVLDPILRDSCSETEVVKCIHMCLQCLQEDPVDRPTMAMIVAMLSSDSATLPVIQRPAFFIRSGSTVKPMLASVDEATITEAQPR